MEEMYAGCDMVAKVKEFTPIEYPLMRENQIILGCIHPAGHPEEVVIPEQVMVKIIELKIKLLLV